MRNRLAAVITAASLAVAGLAAPAGALASVHHHRTLHRSSLRHRHLDAIAHIALM